MLVMKLTKVMKMGEVLDVCCGSKMFWFDKHEPHTTYCDKRTVPYHEYYPNRFLEVRPDIQCDFRNLPFDDESFWHIVFDPPHLTQIADTSWTKLKYGKLDSVYWPDMIHDGFKECWRVLKTNGTLIFKWSEVQIPLSEVLKAIGRNPLYGNRSGKHMTTHWLAFVKFADEANDVQTLF